MSADHTIFPVVSTIDQPHLEELFQIRMTFTRVQTIDNMPSGAGRGAVYVDKGVITGPRMNGQVVPNSGGDYALFRPDGVLAFDARYMLHTDDDELIMMHNKGYLWGRTDDVMPRIRKWIFEDGPEVAPEEYYLRNFPTFECNIGKYDWLMRHTVIGIGERRKDGNLIRYYAVT